MKVFVWECLDHVSDRWHHEGGVVVFATTLERARELVNVYPHCNVNDIEPDYIRSIVGKGEEKVFIFPDAGCC